jgi:hypothetical protein
MRTYTKLLGSGALTLIAVGVTLVVQGGPQAIAAAFAIFQGIVFVTTFLTLRVAADRPRSRRPGWAVDGSEPRGAGAGASASPDAERPRARAWEGRAGRAQPA